MKNWAENGFKGPPIRKISPPGGLLLYRVWGGKSTEIGTGYFSDKKPKSVRDAELRYNIVDWSNACRFVTTFKLKAGFEYFIGPVAHGPLDLSIHAKQVYINPPLDTKILKLQPAEILDHSDGYVVIPQGEINF